MTGYNPNTLRYHLTQLISLRKLAVFEVGGSLRFYENHGRFSDEERRTIGRRWYATSRMILDSVCGFPGITRGEIAEKVGISGPAVTRWMKQFVTEGIVREKREGRSVHYSLASF